MGPRTKSQSDRRLQYDFAQRASRSSPPVAVRSSTFRRRRSCSAVRITRTTCRRRPAVMGLSRAMARELGPYGVRVNTLTPGPTFTEVERATVTPEQKEAMIATQCLRRPRGRRHCGRGSSLLISKQARWGSRTTAQCRRRNNHPLKASLGAIQRERTIRNFLHRLTAPKRTAC